MGDTRPRFRAAFTDAWFRADLLLLTAPQRAAAENARREAERHGVESAGLERCDPEARDGTKLGGCVKQYAGDLRLVYTGAIGADGRPYLQCLAVGLGHRPRGDRRPDAYRIADRRLHRRR
jgi:hypothetical protein